MRGFVSPPQLAASPQPPDVSYVSSVVLAAILKASEGAGSRFQSRRCCRPLLFPSRRDLLTQSGSRADAGADWLPRGSAAWSFAAGASAGSWFHTRRRPRPVVDLNLLRVKKAGGGGDNGAGDQPLTAVAEPRRAHRRENSPEVFRPRVWNDGVLRPCGFDRAFGAAAHVTRLTVNHRSAARFDPPLPILSP